MSKITSLLMEHLYRAGSIEQLDQFSQELLDILDMVKTKKENLLQSETPLDKTQESIRQYRNRMEELNQQS